VPKSNSKVHIGFLTENLEEFLKTYRDKPMSADSFVYDKAIEAPSYINRRTRFKTDADGRFTIPNIGSERIVRLDVHVQGYQEAGMWVVTRKLGAKWKRTKLDENTKSLMSIGSVLPVVYSHEFTHVAVKAAAISGVVLNRVTREPIPNVSIFAHFKGFDGARPVFTDRKGQFTIDGVPTQGEFRLHATRSQAFMYKLKGRRQPLPVLNEVKKGLTYGPAKPLQPQEFELTPAITVRGHVTDDSGNPVKNAGIHYFAAADNKAGLALHDEFEESQERTKADGSFEIPVLRGLGLLLVSAGGDRYEPMSAAEIPLPKRKGFGWQIPVISNRLLLAENYEMGKVISPAADAENYQVDLQLKKLKRVKLKLVDRKGKLVSGAVLNSLTGPNLTIRPRSMRSDSGTLEVPSPTETQPIVAAVRHDARKIGTVLVMTAGKQPANGELRLQPYGTLTGRFVKKGKPMANLEFSVTVEDDAFTAFEEETGMPVNNRLAHGKADGEGRFRITNFVCGQRMKIAGIKTTRENFRMVKHDLASKTLSLRSGEVRDLGDLECKDSPDVD